METRRKKKQELARAWERVWAWAWTVSRALRLLSRWNRAGGGHTRPKAERLDRFDRSRDPPPTDGQEGKEGKKKKKKRRVVGWLCALRSSLASRPLKLRLHRRWPPFFPAPETLKPRLWRLISTLHPLSSILASSHAIFPSYPKPSCCFSSYSPPPAQPCQLSSLPC